MNARLLCLLLPIAAFAQDPVEIVRRAIELDRRDAELMRNYTFLERQEQREYDSNGKLKKSQSETRDVTLLEGSPYRRLVGSFSPSLRCSFEWTG
jgi:hypothetical protein